MFNRPSIKVINSGFQEFDEALGIGGIPRGRITELSGPEDSMKTTFVLNILARMQSNSILPAFIDVDNDVTTDYVTNSNINTELLLMLYSSTDTEIIEHVQKIVNEKAIDIIVIDSAGLINPSKERKITAMFRDMLSRLSVIIQGTETAIIFINQLRHSGRNLNESKTSLCNQAFDAYASIRLRITGWDRETKELDIKVTRNKLCNQLNHVVLKLN